MPLSIRNWLGAEQGASVISLLAVVASLVIIAVVAVPALKSSGASTAASNAQTGSALAQAQDVQAKTLLVDAQTAMSTYSASSSNGFAGATPAALNQIEPTLITASTNQAYIASVNATTDSYTVVAVDPLTGNSFTLVDSGGSVSHSCTTAGHGGCPVGGTW
jgi:hypothetical protein